MEEQGSGHLSALHQGCSSKDHAMPEDHPPEPMLKYSFPAEHACAPSHWLHCPVGMVPAALQG